MSLSAITLAELPRVEATLSYLTPATGKPRCYACGVVQDEPETPARYERRRVKVHDARQNEQPASINGKRAGPLRGADRADIAAGRAQRGVGKFFAEQDPAAFNENVGHDVALRRLL